MSTGTPPPKKRTSLFAQNSAKQKSSPSPRRGRSFKKAKKQEEIKEEQVLSLAQMAMNIRDMEEQGQADLAAVLPKEEREKLSKICDIFSGRRTGKNRFKDIVKSEIDREKEISKGIANNQIIAAVGRRHYERSEIYEDNLEEESEKLEKSGKETDQLKLKVKAAKARYLTAFEKKPKEEEKKKPDHREYGLWDSVNSLKVLPTLLKVKKEWMPHDWDNILEQLKEEGRDLASIDADLKEICHGSSGTTKKKTGKYLMPEDILWCRKHARFAERDLLKWFRRYRTKCPSGDLNIAQFKELYKVPFPMAEVDIVAGIIFEVYDEEKAGKLDFKVR